MENKARCVCPTCPNTLKPVCASDRVQDLSECHLRRQACQGNITVTVTKQGPCGMSVNKLMVIETLVFTWYMFTVSLNPICPASECHEK